MTTETTTTTTKTTPSGGGETPVGANAEVTATEKPAASATPETTTEPVREQHVPLSRLQAVIAQRAEEQRSNEALRRELKLAQDTLDEFRALGNKPAATNGATDPATPAKPAAAAPKALTPEELQRLVAEEGSRQVFNQRCNDAVAEGRKAHTDFDKVVLGDLTSISPVLDRNTGRPVLPIPLIEAALETGQAPEVLYALGQDASEASRIMSLRPIQQAVELAKFATKLTAAAKTSDEQAELPNVSRAPAPIKAPVRAGKTTPSFSIYDTDNFDTAEWIKQREKQVRESRESTRR